MTITLISDSALLSHFGRFPLQKQQDCKDNPESEEKQSGGKMKEKLFMSPKH
jgi:hypothetical protein